MASSSRTLRWCIYRSHLPTLGAISPHLCTQRAAGVHVSPWPWNPATYMRKKEAIHLAHAVLYAKPSRRGVANIYICWASNARSSRRRAVYPAGPQLYSGSYMRWLLARAGKPILAYEAMKTKLPWTWAWACSAGRWTAYELHNQFGCCLHADMRGARFSSVPYRYFKLLWLPTLLNKLISLVNVIQGPMKIVRFRLSWSISSLHIWLYSCISLIFLYILYAIFTNLRGFLFLLSLFGFWKFYFIV